MINNKDLDGLRARFNSDPLFAAHMRAEMEAAPDLADGGIMAALQRVVISSGLCTFDELVALAAEARPMLVDVSCEFLRGDEAGAAATEKYTSWLRAGKKKDG